MHLKARFRRWCHCMRWMFHGHLGVTAYQKKTGRVLVIGCSCGRDWYNWFESQP